VAQTTNSANSGAATVEREVVVPILPPQHHHVPTAAAASSTTFPGFHQEADQPLIQTPPAPAPRPRQDAAFVGTLAAIAALLAARLLLLFSVLGAFVLAYRADGSPGLFVLIAYCLLTVLPLTVLDVITHKRGGR